MWKPLAPVASLRVEGKAGEGPKVSPSKVIQIDPQPLPSARPHSKLVSPAAAAVSSSLACMDHDYCLPNKGTSSWEQGKRWNVKQQSSIVIQTIKDHAPSQTTRCSVAPTNTVLPTKPQDAPQTERPGQKTTNHGPDGGSILETPAASPSQLEAESTYKIRSPRSRHLERSYRRPAASRTPSPRYSRKERTRGRSEKRSRYSSSPMSSSSDSCSSRSRSRSCSPAKKRFVPLKSICLLKPHFKKIINYKFISCFLSLGTTTLTVVLDPRPAPPLGLLAPCLPLLPGGGDTPIHPLVLAPGVAPGPGLGPLRNKRSGIEAEDCTGTVDETRVCMNGIRYMKLLFVLGVLKK